MSNGFRWESADPGKQGIDEVRLCALQRDIASRGGTKALLIARNDRIVCEWYASDSGPAKRQGTASLAKALVGGTSLLLALNDGLMQVDDPACKYLPRWREHPEKSKITIRHLATHTSGIEDAEIAGRSHETLDGWKGDFWAGRGKGKPNSISIALEVAPILFPPGTKYAYSNPGMGALSCAITASLRGTPHEDIYSLLKARVFDPIGVPEEEWSIGYDCPYLVDGLRVFANWGGGEFTARATASIGRLMLRRGDWEGRRLIASSWVDRALTDAGMPRPAGGLPDGTQYESGLCWWVNGDGSWSQAPRDAFVGAGAGDQVLLVVPSLNLIVVRYGDDDLDDWQESGWWSPIVKHLFNPVMEAICG